MSKLTSERIYSHCNKVPVLEQSTLPRRGQVSALYLLINWLDPPETSVRIALPCLRHSPECMISKLSVLIIDQLGRWAGSRCLVMTMHFLSCRHSNGPQTHLPGLEQSVKIWHKERITILPLIFRTDSVRAVEQRARGDFHEAPLFRWPSLCQCRSDKITHLCDCAIVASVPLLQ